MSEDGSRYLNAQEVSELNEAVNQYRENPPDFADPTMDALDAAILKDESLSTLETVTSLARARRAEAERTVEQQRSGISHEMQIAIARDDQNAQSMDDLDQCLRQNVRDTFPLGIGESGKLPAGLVSPDEVLGKKPRGKR